MPDPVPFFMTKPSIIIGPTATPVIELQCAANHVALTPEQDSTDYPTYCGNFTADGAVKWTLTITVLQSFGVDGVWTKLAPVVGTSQPFQLLPNGDAVPSVDNPAQTGTCTVRAFPFWDGGVNEPAEIDIELVVQGDLIEVTSGALMASADEDAA